jgi:hypothetical protein
MNFWGIIVTQLLSCVNFCGITASLSTQGGDQRATLLNQNEELADFLNRRERDGKESQTMGMPFLAISEISPLPSLFRRWTQWRVDG